MNRLVLLVLIHCVAGCRPPVDLQTYDPGSDQLIFLVSGSRPQQTYYRVGGDASHWVGTASTTLEAPPPESGAWDLKFDDWEVVQIPDAKLGWRTALACAKADGNLRSIAESFAIGRCDHDSDRCCSQSGVLLVGAGSTCVLPAEWGPRATGFCATNRLIQ